MNWRQWSRRAEQLSEELRDEAREHVGDSMRVRKLAIAAAVLAALFIALGIYWSREPAAFDVAASVKEARREQTLPPVPGAVTTATLAQIISTLLDKSGGFIGNDIAPPGVWLDNMPNWERGALEQARDMLRSLRDDFGRAADANGLDEDLARAEPRLSFSANSWMLPASESQYRDAHDYVRSYLSRLRGDAEKNADQPAAQFAATAANLERYLARVTARLDASARKLSECVAPRENPLLQSNSLWRANDAEHAPSTTPSAQIDDVFFAARGSAWALQHLLRAIEIDFADTLREKHAQRELQEAIRALSSAQNTIYSPVILNGSGFGLVANHSLVMASYMARAETALAHVRELLAANASAGAEADSVISAGNTNTEGNTATEDTSKASEQEANP